MSFMMMTTANHGETQDKNNAIGAGDCDAASCGTHDTQCNRFSMMDDFLSILVPSLTVIICRLCCTNATTQSPQQTLSLSLNLSLIHSHTHSQLSLSLSLSLLCPLRVRLLFFLPTAPVVGRELALQNMAPMPHLDTVAQTLKSQTL